MRILFLYCHKTVFQKELFRVISTGLHRTSTSGSLFLFHPLRPLNNLTLNFLFLFYVFEQLSIRNHYSHRNIFLA